MRDFLANQLNVAVLILIFTMFSFARLSWSEDLDEIYLLDEPITIDCQNESVDNVIRDISRKSGLEITYDQELENEPINIAFNDTIPAMDAVVRLLRGKNTVIEFSHNRENLNIRYFGNTGYSRE
jgi:hypothetical protein